MDEEYELEYKNKEYRIWEEWEKLKQNKKSFIEVFKSLEEQAVKEIYEAKDIVTIRGKRVSEIIPNGETSDSKMIQYLIEKIGYMSIYNRHVIEENYKYYEELIIDNISLFKALIIINLFAIMYHYKEDYKEDVGLKVVFEKEEYRVEMEDMIDEFFRSIFKGMYDVKFSVK